MADLVEAFRKVERIIGASWKEYASDPEYLSIDDLHQLVQAEFCIEIDMKAVAFRGQRVKGVIERYENDGKRSAAIYVRRDQSMDELRLTTVKELCHVIIDNNADFNPDGLETLSGLLQPPDLGKGSIWSEHLARIMANELVYPHEYRQNDADRVESGETTIEQLVLQRRVPDYIVERVLSPRYIKVCGEVWSKVQATHGDS